MPAKKKKKNNKKLLSNILKICFTAFLVLMALFAIYVVMVVASASMEEMDVDKYIMNYILALSNYKHQKSYLIICIVQIKYKI